MDIDLKEEIRKQDELLAEYLRVIEIQKGLIQEQKTPEVWYTFGVFAVYHRYILSSCLLAL